MSLHHLTPTHVHATPLRLHDRQAKRQEAGKPEHREQACTIRRDHAQTGQASAGRTSAPLVPAAIRVTGVSLEPEHRDYIRKRLGSKLGKYATSIERVSVRVRDVNGPRGGIDLSAASRSC